MRNTLVLSFVIVSFCGMWGYAELVEEFPICTRSGTQSYPAISGDIVVWEDNRNGNYDIYGYNLSTQTEFAVCTQGSSQYEPAISGDVVVWPDDRNGNNDIYGYNLSTQTEFAVCTQSDYQGAPAISGDIVVWANHNELGDDIYGFDLRTWTEFAICTYSDFQLAPAISGNVVVWMDARNGPSDIYGYNLSTQTEFAICTQIASQDIPAISGDIVVWVDTRNGNGDIYGASLSRFLRSFDTCEKGSYVFDNEPFYGTSVDATGEDVSSCAYNDVYDVWNRYIPAQGGTVTITTDGSTFDTVLSVYEGCGGAELACNDDYTYDHPCSQIVMNVVKGKTYYIRIAGFNGETGDYDLLITHGECSDRPQSDINNDCKVDLQDFVIMAAEWLSCGYSDPGDC